MLNPLARRAAVTAATAAALAGVAVLPGGAAARTATAPTAHPISHVLLVSVDGLHQSDLSWYERHDPSAALSRLAEQGAQYTGARTPVPSDSFPGMLALATGGDPSATGVYYDAEYNHDLLAPGTTDCANATPGTAVTYDESIDRDPTALDAGQGLPDLPGDILDMTGHPTKLIDPATLPVDPATCRPVYPHQYLQVNTIFNVAHDAGLRTAWSDKHPAYEILNGPEGNGVDDLFTPEINSDAIGFPAGNDWTTDNAATEQYDGYKVQAVLNEIAGDNHKGTRVVGTPAVFGMNFQTVSTAEKLPSSDGLAGGYVPGTTTPGPLLQRALNFVSDRIGEMQSALQAHGLADSTAIIVTAKHGQSPQNPNDLTRIDDGPIIAGINAAWTRRNPGAGPLVAGGTDDDAIMLWLSDRSQAAAQFVSGYLLSHSATGNTADGGSRTLAASGLRKVYAGTASAKYFGVPVYDPRHPDVYGIVQHGVVYTSGTSKIAEHGGADPEDRRVPIVVDAPGAVAPGQYGTPVETTSVAPTILRLLGLNPDSLQAVQIEHTAVLPGVR